MSPSRFLVLFAFTGAALLAACGGGGGSSVTPSSGSTATPTPGSTATPTPGSSSTPANNAVFGGGTQTKSFTSGGGTFNSTADNSYTVSATFGSNNASGAFNFTMSWATYAQITGTFAPGPLPSTMGTALLYLDFHTPVDVSFTQTPAVTVTTTGSFPGTHCDFAVYGQPGSGSGSSPTWFSGTAVGVSEVTPSGSTVSVSAVTLPPPDTVDFHASSDQYIALYCH